MEMKNKKTQQPETIFDIAYWQEETLKARRDFEKLQAAILDYFNDYDIHPYSAGLDDVWPLAKIKVNEKKNGWELVKK